MRYDHAELDSHPVWVFFGDIKETRLPQVNGYQVGCFSLFWRFFMVKISRLNVHQNCRIVLLYHSQSIRPLPLPIFSLLSFFFNSKEFKKWKVGFDIGEMSVHLSVRTPPKRVLTVRFSKFFFVGKVCHQKPIFCTFFCTSVRTDGRTERQNRQMPF